MEFLSNLTFADWEIYLFDLSLVGSKILAVTAGVLTVLLFARKLIEKYWNRYVEKKRGWIQLLLKSYIDKPKDMKVTQLTILGRADRLILKRMLLDGADDAEGEKAQRLSEVYDAVGFGKEHILMLRFSILWWKRAEAAHHLGLMHIRQSRPYLLKALNDKSIEVRLEATWALGHMGFVEDLPKIVKSMSYFFKIAALRMDAFIFEMGKPALPVLLDLCQTTEWEVQLLAIHLAGEFKDKDALPVLYPILKSEHKECRIATCKAIGTIGEAEGLRTLLPLTQDEAWEMRAQVAKQFGRNRFEEGIPHLKKGLEDRAWWVRFNTGEAFSLMGAIGKDALTASLQSQDRFARDMANQWLDELEAAHA